MKFFVVLFMISFLKQNISSNSCIVQTTVIFDCCCSYIYIYTPDSSIFMLNAVNGLYRFQDIFYRIMQRIFTSLDSKTFMSHILQCNDFLANLILSKLLAGNRLVFDVVRTVYATVYTVV